MELQAGLRTERPPNTYTGNIGNFDNFYLFVSDGVLETTLYLTTAELRALQNTLRRALKGRKIK